MLSPDLLAEKLSKPSPRPPLVFAEEGFTATWPEFRSLAEAHWQETEMYRHGDGFAPNLGGYDDYNRRGLYRFYTVRCEGVLVGDCGMYITPSMHSRKLIATEDTWYLLPRFRVGRNAIRFYQYVEAEMKKLGVTNISMTTKITNGAGRVLEYLGYAHVANQYCKEI